MLRNLFALSLVASLLACGYFKKSHDEQQNPSPSQDLDAKGDSYCAESAKLANSNGWVGHDCDLLLFNSLRAVSCKDSSVNILAAEGPAPGEYWRDSEHTCGPDKAPAKLSRDMVTGLLIWIWSQGREKGLPIINRFISYLESHNGYFCDTGDIIKNESYCNPGSGLAATIYEIRFQFGGGDSDKRNGKVTWDPVNTAGYQAHIGALHLYLRGLIFGGISSYYKEFFDLMHDKQGNNQLFQAMRNKFIDGDESGPTNALIGDIPYFPLSGLPTSQGRCTDYLWQRDQNGDDWKPCPVGSPLDTYTGIDFMFARAVINDALPANHSMDLGVRGNFWPYHPRVK